MTNLNAIDEYVNFQESNVFLDELISQVSGADGSAVGYAAQAARGLLGFGKDLVMGVGELAYEGVKAVPKLAQLTQTQSGQLYAQLDAQILAENIKLGNVTTASVGHATLNIGKAIVKPVADPWAKGAYVESITRGLSEVATLGMGWLKGSKVTKAAKVVDAGASASGKTAHVAKILKPAVGGSSSGAAPSVSTGVHIKLGKKPAFSGNWKNYRTHGIKTDPMLSPEGRRMVEEFEKKGLSHDDAIQDSMDLIQTGSSMPLANPIEVGDKFYKIIPEGGSVGTNSAFWATREEVMALEGLSYDEIADKLGIPLISQQGGKYQVMEISALRNGTSFTSVIAPTTEVGENGAIWSQSGGRLQTLLLDRSAFSSPESTRIKIP